MTKYEIEMPDCPEGMEWLVLWIPVQKTASAEERRAIERAAANSIRLK